MAILGLTSSGSRRPCYAPFKDYASEVAQRLQDSELFVDVDNGENTLPMKIRNGGIAQYNFILVVGEEEMRSQSVNVRNREDVGTKAPSEMIKLDDVVVKLFALNKGRRLENKLL